ncbi:hypothetical protein YC2023_053100 [Brassica napus]
MATKKFLSLIYLMVLVQIFLPMISGQTKECFLQQPCENSPTCNEFCKSKGYIKGGYCQHYLGPNHNNCCCYLVDSEKFFKFDHTNVLITN